MKAKKSVNNTQRRLIKTVIKNLDHNDLEKLMKIGEKFRFCV